MPILKNTGKQPIRAITGHIIMPDAEIEVDHQTLERFANDPYMSGQMKRGFLVVTHEAQPVQEEYSRTWIAKAKKADIVKAVAERTDLDNDTLDSMNMQELRDVAVEVLIGEDQ